MSNSVFVLVGRVCDCDDLMMFIPADNDAQAKEAFVERLKAEQDWDGSSDVYVEFCVSLSDFQQNHFYDSAFSSETFN